MYKASREGHAAIVQLLLSEQADVNIRTSGVQMSTAVFKTGTSKANPDDVDGVAAAAHCQPSASHCHRDSAVPTQPRNGDRA